MRRPHRPTMTSIVAAGIAAIAVGGVAYGAIPGADGKIRGCYQADPAGSSGVLKNLYVVDESDRCPPGTQELPWNQQGPIGPTGATGPTGADGRAETAHGSYRTDVRFVHENVELNEIQPDSEWAVIECDRDETAIGGGGAIDQPFANKNNYALSASVPMKGERRWGVRVTRVGGYTPARTHAKKLEVDAWAVCARTIVVPNPPQAPATGRIFGPRP